MRTQSVGGLDPTRHAHAHAFPFPFPPFPPLTEAAATAA